MSSSDRPPWDTSVPGSPPQLDEPVTEEEVAAALKRARELEPLANSGLLTDESRFLLDARRHEEAHRANLIAFMETDDEKQIAFHRRGLSDALLGQGRFEAARYFADTPEQIKEIDSLDYACKRPNTDKCDCPRQEAELADPAYTNAQAVACALNRRFQGRQIFNPYEGDGQVVWVWTCSLCGHRNARPNPPKRQEQLIHARMVAERNEQPVPQLNDSSLLLQDGSHSV